MQMQNPNTQTQGQQNQPMPGVGQQNRMSEPPKMVSTKDLAYIKDALSWELDVIKKFNHFARETQDAKTKSLIQKGAQMHQKQYEMLLKHLNPAGPGQ